MGAMPSRPSRRDAHLEDLVADAVDAFEQGGDARLAAFLEGLSSDRDAVAGRLEQLRELGLLGVPSEPRLERLGEFRLTELLGAGGMGVVYRAVQESLGRDVAVKVIRPEHVYFPGARQRFRREVEIIARLQHPGVVPIYSVGEERGVPYFAMELLRGATLEVLLQRVAGREVSELEGRDLAPDPEEPGYLFEGTWEQACLRVVRQVAEALEHAHERGVVHRDIKPSNVLVTQDGSGRVVLLDFGLAGSEGSGRLTRTGARLGSLPYMSPEQARGGGQALRPATDIYSLGVVLYELLTLRPAFGGGSETEVARAIERGSVAMPRTLNPKISRDAETVCLTAIAVEPQRRYATAGDFARDLDNVLAGRPVDARRTGAIRRTWKWMQRNPAAAVALTLGGLLLVGVPSGYAWQEGRASLVVAAQRDRAERNFERALTAVDRMLSRLGGVDLRFVPQMEPVRKAVLEDALALLEEFVRDEGASGAARLQVARAHARLGELFRDLGRTVEAAAAFEKACAAFEALTPGVADADAVRRELVSNRLRQASAFVNGGQPAEALEACREVKRQLAIHPGEVPEWVEMDAVEVEVLEAQAFELLDRVKESLVNSAKAAVAADALVKRHPNVLAALSIAQATWNFRGQLLGRHATREGEGNEEAERALERTVELGEAMVAASNSGPADRAALAIARGNLAGAYRRAKKWTLAEESYARARRELEELVASFPETLGYKLELATICNQEALLLEYQKKLDGVEEACGRTVAILEDLTAKAPGDALLWARLGTARSNLGSPFLARGERAKTQALLVKSMDAFRRASALSPENREVFRELVNNGKNLAYVRRLEGDHAGAAAVVEELMGEFPSEPYPAQIAAVQIALGVPLVRDSVELDEQERKELCEEYAKRAMDALREALRRGAPRPPSLRSMRDFQSLHGLAAFEELASEFGEPAPAK